MWLSFWLHFKNKGVFMDTVFTKSNRFLIGTQNIDSRLFPICKVTGRTLLLQPPTNRFGRCSQKFSTAKYLKQSKKRNNFCWIIRLRSGMWLLPAKSKAPATAASNTSFPMIWIESCLSPISSRFIQTATPHSSFMKILQKPDTYGRNKTAIHKSRKRSLFTGETCRDLESITQYTAHKK